MRRMLSFALGCVACLCVLIATERRAMAMYVDPGSGLLFLQAAGSAAAAAAFFLRRKIRGLFGKGEALAPLSAEKSDPRNPA